MIVQILVYIPLLLHKEHSQVVLEYLRVTLEVLHMRYM